MVLIKVNRKDGITRQRFTVAHEIAHFLLHKHVIDSNEKGIIDNVLYRSNTSNRNEIEANHLDAYIVMPSEVVKKIWREEKDLDQLANDFNVSVSALKLRLENLGLKDRVIG